MGDFKKKNPLFEYMYVCGLVGKVTSILFIILSLYLHLQFLMIVIKHCEVFETLLYFQADKLASHTFKDASRRHRLMGHR